MQAHFLRHLKIGLLCTSVICASCLDSGLSTRPEPTPFPDPSPAAQAFIDSAGLPLYHDSYQLFVQGNVEVFGASYGPGMDCPSGCINSSVLGLRVAAKVGWLLVRDYNAGFAPDSARYFDVSRADSALGGEPLWIGLKAVDKADNWFWQSYLPLLARDSDVARDALLRIPQWLYARVPYPALGVPAAEALPGNYVVQTGPTFSPCWLNCLGPKGIRIRPFGNVRKRISTRSATKARARALTGRCSRRPLLGVG